MSTRSGSPSPFMSSRARSMSVPLGNTDGAGARRAPCRRPAATSRFRCRLVPPTDAWASLTGLPLVLTSKPRPTSGPASPWSSPAWRSSREIDTAAMPSRRPPPSAEQVSKRVRRRASPPCRRGGRCTRCSTRSGCPESRRRCSRRSRVSARPPPAAALNVATRPSMKLKSPRGRASAVPCAGSADPGWRCRRRAGLPACVPSPYSVAFPPARQIGWRRRCRTDPTG